MMSPRSNRLKSRSKELTTDKIDSKKGWGGGDALVHGVFCKSGAVNFRMYVLDNYVTVGDGPY